MSDYQVITFGDLQNGSKFTPFEMFVETPHFLKIAEFKRPYGNGVLNTLDLYTSEYFYTSPDCTVYIPDFDQLM